MSISEPGCVLFAAGQEEFERLYIETAPKKNPMTVPVDRGCTHVMTELCRNTSKASTPSIGTPSMPQLYCALYLSVRIFFFHSPLSHSLFPIPCVSYIGVTRNTPTVNWCKSCLDHVCISTSRTRGDPPSSRLRWRTHAHLARRDSSQEEKKPTNTQSTELRSTKRKRRIRR